MPFRKGLCKAGMLILSNIGVGFRTGTADYTVPKPGSNTPPPAPFSAVELLPSFPPPLPAGLAGRKGATGT